jgi:sigma-B regulation protein RsbU (phosphoserine phosphatase)
MEVSFAAVAWIRPMLSPVDLVRQVFAMAAISLFFANLGAKSGTASTKDVARRIRFVWLGAAAGLTPMFVVGLNSLLGGGDIGAGLPVWFLYLAIGCLAIFPLTLAYVILVQRAMDVRVAIRQSVRYTLARGGVWLVGVAMLTLALRIFVGVSLNKGGFTIGQIALLAIGAVLLLLRRRYRSRSSGGSTGASSAKLTAPNSC